MHETLDGVGVLPIIESAAGLAAVTALGAAAGLGEFVAASSAMFAASLGIYLFACAGAAAHSATLHGWAVAPFLPVLFAVYHFGYGCVHHRVFALVTVVDGAITQWNLRGPGLTDAELKAHMDLVMVAAHRAGHQLQPDASRTN